MDYEDFVAKRLEFIISYEQHDPPMTQDHRNMFAYLRNQALGKYLNLLQEEQVFEAEELLSAFHEYARHSSKLKLVEKVSPDDPDEWYKTTETFIKSLIEE